jgi:membrane protease YdiL (CAAX protease family)
LPDSESPTPVASPSSDLRDFFFGDDGLRAGWSLLLAFVLFVVLSRAFDLAIRRTHILPVTMRDQTGLLPGPMAIEEGVGVALICLTCLLTARIERRPFSRYGLSARRMVKDLLFGLVCGVICLSLLVGALYLAHGIAFDGVALHGAPLRSYAGKWALVFLLVGLFEEFSTRGFLQYTLARGVAGIVRSLDPRNRHSHAIGFWVAALLFSVGLFVAGHLGNSGENLVGLTAVGVVGLVFAFSLYRTGTLWWAIGAHASWDWGQSFLYGTPDSSLMASGHLLITHPIGSRLLSGGPDGPEGSILCLPVLLSMGLIVYVTLPRRDYPLTPDQAAPPNPLN